jgi:hypothetical protein
MGAELQSYESYPQEAQAWEHEKQPRFKPRNDKKAELIQVLKRGGIPQYFDQPDTNRRSIPSAKENRFNIWEPVNVEGTRRY